MMAKLDRDKFVEELEVFSKNILADALFWLFYSSVLRYLTLEMVFPFRKRLARRLKDITAIYDVSI